ncbi:MAG TPA: hypothetical protein VNN22_07640 [Verrucomicrobiae bacterium]|nr:hypothetical protein [Verrucomicrobiae bacterium]
MNTADLEKILHDTLAKFNSETGTIHRPMNRRSGSGSSRKSGCRRNCWTW